jgi:hypothetical protein
MPNNYNHLLWVHDNYPNTRRAARIRRLIRRTLTRRALRRRFSRFAGRGAARLASRARPRWTAGLGEAAGLLADGYALQQVKKGQRQALRFWGNKIKPGYGDTAAKALNWYQDPYGQAMKSAFGWAIGRGRKRRLRPWSKPFNLGPQRRPARKKAKKHRHAPATLQPTIAGPKRFKGSVFKKLGVTVAHDEHEEVTNSRTVYFGHYTHPHKAVIQVICHALAKYINYKCFGAQCASIEDKLGGDSTLSRGSFRVIITYRTNVTADDMTEDKGALIVGTSSVLTLSTTIRNRLYGIFGDTADSQSIVLDAIKVVPQDIDTAGSTSFYIPCKPLEMRAQDLTFVVKGYSMMKYQNSTLSETTAPSSDKHDVNANPLEGKIYDGKGSYYNIKRIDLDANEYEGNLEVNAQTGLGTLYDGGASASDPEVNRLLEHPPTHKVWYGLASSRNTTLNPGAMNRSVISRTHKLKLNGWLRIYARRMKGSLATDGLNSERTSVGRSRWVGLDKSIHDAGDPNTTVNVECHVEVSAYLIERKKNIFTGTYPVIATS